MIVSLVKNQVKLEGVDEYIKVATKFAQDMKSIEIKPAALAA